MQTKAWVPMYPWVQYMCMHLLQRDKHSQTPICQLCVELPQTLLATMCHQLLNASCPDSLHRSSCVFTSGCHGGFWQGDLLPPSSQIADHHVHRIFIRSRHQVELSKHQLWRSLELYISNPKILAESTMWQEASSWLLGLQYPHSWSRQTSGFITSSRAKGCEISMTFQKESWSHNLNELGWKE